MSKSQVPIKSQYPNPKSRRRWSLGLGHWTFRAQRGFSLLELIIAVAILLVIAGGLVVTLSSFRASTDLDRSATGVLSFVRLARERTIASESDTQWGVHVAAGQIALFQGTTYTGTDEDTIVLPPGITASWSLTGGGADVVFARIEGTTTTNGTITLTSTSGETRVATVFVSGEVALAASLPSQLNTRVTDTRHVHFALPFSLDASTTMTLTYAEPDPDVVESIDVQANIISGQFLWEGTVSVSGEDQVLRIVSHSIGVADTDLSVRRDRMENTRQLIIDIDATYIATYSPTGALAVNPSVTATIQ